MGLNWLYTTVAFYQGPSLGPKWLHAFIAGSTWALQCAQVVMS